MACNFFFFPVQIELLNPDVIQIVTEGETFQTCIRQIIFPVVDIFARIFAAVMLDSPGEQITMIYIISGSPLGLPIRRNDPDAPIT